jgi:hypothetical protein
MKSVKIKIVRLPHGAGLPLPVYPPNRVPIKFTEGVARARPELGVAPESAPGQFGHHGHSGHRGHFGQGGYFARCIILNGRRSTLWRSCAAWVARSMDEIVTSRALTPRSYRSNSAVTGQ